MEIQKISKPVKKKKKTDHKKSSSAASNPSVNLPSPVRTSPSGSLIPHDTVLLDVSLPTTTTHCNLLKPKLNQDKLPKHVAKLITSMPSFLSASPVISPIHSPNPDQAFTLPVPFHQTGRPGVVY